MAGNAGIRPRMRLTTGHPGFCGLRCRPTGRRSRPFVCAPAIVAWLADGSQLDGRVWARIGRYPAWLARKVPDLAGSLVAQVEGDCGVADFFEPCQQ